MKTIIFILGFILTGFVTKAQATIDMRQMTVDDLRDIRKQVYDKYSASNLPYTAFDLDFLNRLNDAITKNPRVNATFAFSKIPIEYQLEPLRKMAQEYGRFEIEREKYRKFKRLLKMVYTVDTNVVNTMQGRDNLWKLPRGKLLEIINEN